jgi:hypothetical protein
MNAEHPAGMAAILRRSGARVKSKAKFSSLRQGYDAARKAKVLSFAFCHKLQPLAISLQPFCMG